jgi:Bacterial archaeo-eukaryotic release factor family 3
MSALSKDHIRELLEPCDGPCVSLYLPTFRAGAETQQNPIRFKNLLREAQNQLEERGLRAAEAEEVLAEARGLVDDGPFWQRQSDGLALFVARGFLRTHQLPRELPELAIVDSHFYLKPLFPLLTGDGHFYVLGLSMNHVRLLAGDREGLREVELGDDVPLSLTEALGEELTQQMLQFNVNNPSAQGRQGAPRYHGHGGGEDDGKPEIEKFFNLVDRGLRKRYLDRDGHAPLVLAGVDYLLPLFREASEYPNLVEQGITGNPERLRPEELHQQAWAIVEPIFQEDQRRAADRYADLAGTGRGSSQLGEVLAAAHDGRIDTLWTAQGARLWGHFDPATREVAVEEEGRRNGNEDLLDLAAVQTFLNGGTVFAVEPEAVPAGGEPLAALFRY